MTVMRFLVCAAAALISAGSFAQVKVALYAGPQATSARYLVNDIKQPTAFRYGLQAGAMLKVPFENRLYFAPALYYSLKGYTVTLNNGAYPPGPFAKNNTTRLHTIEIAPLLSFDMSDNPSHFFIQAGPSLDFAIAGHEKFDLINGQTTSQKMKFGFTDYGVVTASAIARLGYETGSGFLIFGHYAYGLGSANNADNGPVIRHRVIGVSVGKYVGRTIR